MSIVNCIFFLNNKITIVHTLLPILQLEFWTCAEDPSNDQALIIYVHRIKNEKLAEEYDI